MKHLKDSLKKMDGKYATIESLSVEDKKSTYGGSGALVVSKIAAKPKKEILLCYGIPSIPDDLC